MPEVMRNGSRYLAVCRPDANLKEVRAVLKASAGETIPVTDLDFEILAFGRPCEWMRGDGEGI